MMKVKKKEAFQRTKVVVRHLPPSLSQSYLFSQFDHLFSHRYNWVCFRPAKSSNKHQRYSRAYIDFKSPDDVLEFAEFFNGHVFVNEKGAQFKAIIEYAPSQRVPKLCARKDSREGTIYKDPDYLEFLKHIAKPVENRPSFKFQLESNEAEQSGAAKETPISTPLMEYVRQKRAAEVGTQDSVAVVKVSKRAGQASLNRRSSSTTKRGSDRKKYVPRGSAKKSNEKEKSVVIVAPRKENEPTNSYRKKIPEIQAFSASEESVSKVTSSADCGKKKILLLKGKEHENFLVSEGLLQRSVPTSPVGNSPISTAPKQNQQCEASERLIRSILLNNEACQNQSSQPVLSQQKFRSLNLKSNKGPTQPTNAQVGLKGQLPHSEPSPFISGSDAKKTSDEKFMKKDSHSSVATSERQEKYTRNKDRPDRGIWTPQQRFEFQNTKEKNLSSTIFPRLHSDSVGDDMRNWNRTREAAGPSNGSNSSSGENGLHRRGKHTATHNVKGNRNLNTTGGKSSKKASATGFSAYEKQVWVQKPSSGS